jgi:hypothetical protein
MKAYKELTCRAKAVLLLKLGLVGNESLLKNYVQYLHQ